MTKGWRYDPAGGGMISTPYLGAAASSLPISSGIGGNAVVAAFSDSDFGGPGQQGYTNRKGHKFGFGYGLTDNITLNYTGFFVQPLHPSTLVANSTNESVFRSQVDLNYKF
jgi:hypothetical protein